MSTAVEPTPSEGSCILSRGAERAVPCASGNPLGEQTRLPSDRPTPPDEGSVAGKQLGIVVSAGSSRHLVEHVKRRFEELGASAELLTPVRSDALFDDRTEIEASHTLAERPSTDFDFVVVLPGLETPQPLGEEIALWAKPFRALSKPIAIGAQAAERLGFDIDNTAVFDVSTCDAFVQICKNQSILAHP